MLGLALAWPGPAFPAGTDGREFDCVLKPSREVRLSVPVSGVIESVRVDRGDRVAKGDVVASLDSDVERAAVALAKRRAEATAKIESGEAQFDMDSLGSSSSGRRRSCGGAPSAAPSTASWSSESSRGASTGATGSRW